MPTAVRRPEFEEYADKVITYHQYKDALELSAGEARAHPDTLEVFSELYEVVNTSPELIAAYCGVVKRIGDRRAEAITTVRGIETDILSSLRDLDVINDARYEKHHEALQTDPEIKERAYRFMRLFKQVIPKEQLPVRRAKPKPKSLPRGTGLASGESPKDETPPTTDTAGVVFVIDSKPRSLPQKFEAAFIDSPTNVVDDARELGRGAAKFILDGDQTDRMSIADMKQALRGLAGSEALEDEAVMKRYEIVQLHLAKHAQATQEDSPKVLSKDYLANALSSRPAWQKDASCLGATTKDFYRVESDPIYSAKAKAVCANCRVKDECLEAAMIRNDNDGVWGGLTSAQRKMLRRIALSNEADPSEIADLIEQLRADDGVYEADPLDTFDELFDAAAHDSMVA